MVVDEQWSTPIRILTGKYLTYDSTGAAMNYTEQRWIQDTEYTDTHRR